MAPCELCGTVPQTAASQAAHDLEKPVRKEKYLFRKAHRAVDENRAQAARLAVRPFRASMAALQVLYQLSLKEMLEAP